MFRMSSDSKPAFLSPAEIGKIARLARLELTPAEFAVIAPQLESIVAHMEKIAEIPEGDLPGTEAPPPTPLRSDHPVPGEGLRELAENAGSIAHGHVPVPRVVDSAR